ncbi:MAG: hypothetical protein QOJ70_2681 [Acidobacteriota bacterium]|jgi:hypothetical protein|nr:hypothetical protein [Acidobacteriota bacterium]
MSTVSSGGSLQSLTCNSCGATVHLTGEQFVTCLYCGQVYNLSEFRGPRRGELLLGADLCDPNLPGWRVYQKDHLHFGDDGQPQLVGNFPKKENTAWLLESSGSFDNIDATVTISFLEVEDITKHCRLGFAVRSTDEGRYCVDIAPKGNYCVASYEKEADKKQWRMLVDFVTHPALRIGVGVSNRLRVVAYNDHLRVYINNVLVSSVRDSKFSYGTIGIVLENPGSDAKFALSDLELREAVENI